MTSVQRVCIGLSTVSHPPSGGDPRGDARREPHGQVPGGRAHRSVDRHRPLAGALLKIGGRSGPVNILASGEFEAGKSLFVTTPSSKFLIFRFLFVGFSTKEFLARISLLKISSSFEVFYRSMERFD